MSSQKQNPSDVLVEIGKKREQARYEERNSDPESIENAYKSGYEQGLREALAAFEQLDEFDKAEILPEWSIGLENEDGDWDWYYPHAVTREKAIEKAREMAREDLGTGYLRAYEVRSPIAVTRDDTDGDSA